MVKPVRYGIIGCGMMGQEHIRNIALLPGAEIAAIFDPDSEMTCRSKALAPEAVTYDRIEALVSHESMDAVLIASPNFCHIAQLEQIAAQRALPLLVEKPLFTDPADVPRLEALRDNYPAPIWVAMEYRYMPVIAQFLGQAQEATGGIKMLSLREHRFPFLEKVGDWNRFNRYTGGTFVEKCCHFFDLMRHALRAEPVRVMASAAQAVNHLDESYADGTPDILDNGYVIVDFDTGARAMLELCMFAEGSAYQEEISAVGPAGKIEAFVPGPGRFWPDALGSQPVAKLVTSPRAPRGPRTTEIPVDPALLEAGDHNGSTFYQHQRFAALVRGETRTPEVGLLDGWAAVAMGIAAQVSAETGQSVDPRKWMARC
ncbi:MAG: Gfo/Idh/MocA family oxidoreductase [Pseudomonadota bacterium]